MVWEQSCPLRDLACGTPIHNPTNRSKGFGPGCGHRSSTVTWFQSFSGTVQSHSCPSKELPSNLVGTLYNFQQELHLSIYLITGLPSPEKECYPSPSPTERGPGGSPTSPGTRQGSQLPKPLVTEPPTSTHDKPSISHMTHINATQLKSRMQYCQCRDPTGKGLIFQNQSVKTVKEVWSFTCTDTKQGCKNNEESSKYDTTRGK